MKKHKSVYWLIGITAWLIASIAATIVGIAFWAPLACIGIASIVTLDLFLALRYLY